MESVKRHIINYLSSIGYRVYLAQMVHKSVRESVWSSVYDPVWNSVMDSVMDKI